MNPSDALALALEEATGALDFPQDLPAPTREALAYVVECPTNRAGVRLLLACLLAKLEHPHFDIRKPYTEIGGDDCFSGRTYDQQYLERFLSQNHLPCNSTTGFLTPAFRNIDSALTPDVAIVGRPKQLYVSTLSLLDDVQAGRADPWRLLVEAMRLLLLARDRKAARLKELIEEIADGACHLPLSSEEVVTLIEQHLRCKGASRLPVLVVAAAYNAAAARLGEMALPLRAHNAADKQTHALGDVEIRLESDEKVVTAYEMKAKPVTVEDVDIALGKIAGADRIDNYIFVTTYPIDPDVARYAAGMYEQTGGVEIAILDCLQFLRHFLHLFHRLRAAFLDAYQELVLEEPASAVGQALKEAFLALRGAAEADA